MRKNRLGLRITAAALSLIIASTSPGLGMITFAAQSQEAAADSGGNSEGQDSGNGTAGDQGSGNAGDQGSGNAGDQGGEGVSGNGSSGAEDQGAGSGSAGDQNGGTEEGNGTAGNQGGESESGSGGVNDGGTAGNPDEGSGNGNDGGTAGNPDGENGNGNDGGTAGNPDGENGNVNDGGTAENPDKESGSGNDDGAPGNQGGENDGGGGNEEAGGNGGSGANGSGSGNGQSTTEPLIPEPIIITDIQKAAYFSGEGSEEEPYEIGTTKDLEMLSQLVAEGDEEYSNSCYRLIHNLKLKDKGSRRSNFTPIGNERYPFNGVFDGNGYVIRRINIYGPDDVNLGLFGVVGDGARVHSVGVSGSIIYGKKYVGAIAGTNYGSIDSCFQDGSIYARKDGAGGVTGLNRGGIANCYNSGTIGGSYKPGEEVKTGTASKSKRWMSLSDFVESVSEGNKSYLISYAGGIAGYNEGSISQSYQIGNIGAAHNGWGLGAAAGSSEIGVVDGFWYLEGTAWSGVYGQEDHGGIQSAPLADMIGGSAVGFLDFDQSVWVSAEETHANGQAAYSPAGPGLATDSQAEPEGSPHLSGGYIYYFPQLKAFAQRGQEFPFAKGIYEEGKLLVDDLSRTAVVYHEEGWNRLFGSGEQTDRSRFLSYRITLAADLDFTDVTVSPGTMEIPFTGSLNGGGFVISNQSFPLFGVMGPGSEVENLLMTDASIKNVILYQAREGSEEGTVRKNGTPVLTAGTGILAA